MFLSLLLATHLAAVPPVSEAEALAARGDAEALFLKFSAVTADEYSEAERRRLGAALVKAAEAARKDPFIAIGLAEKAVALDKTAAGLTLLALVEVDLDQRESAARHLDEALALEPGNARTCVARAELAMKEQDFAVAVAHFEKALAAGAKVKPQLAKAREEHEKKRGAVEGLKQAESQIQARVAQATRNATQEWLRQIALEDEEATARRRMAPDGVRQQEMRNFVFTYSAGKRNAGEMLEFEKKVERVLEKTYDFVSDKLGHRIEKRTPVVLYSRGEYQAKYSGTPLAAASGFWDGDQIVINGGSSIDAEFAQVMVHEFTHAMVSDIAGHGRVPKWLNEGLAENMRLSAIGREGRIEDHARAMLAGYKRAGTLPPLLELDPMFNAMGPDVGVAYALAGVAMKVLVDRRNHAEVVELLRDVRKGQRVGKALEHRFMDVERLMSAVADEIG